MQYIVLFKKTCDAPHKKEDSKDFDYYYDTSFNCYKIYETKEQLLSYLESRVLSKYPSNNPEIEIFELGNKLKESVKVDITCNI